MAVTALKLSNLFTTSPNNARNGGVAGALTGGHYVSNGWHTVSSNSNPTLVGANTIDFLATAQRWEWAQQYRSYVQKTSGSMVNTVLATTFKGFGNSGYPATFISYVQGNHYLKFKLENDLTFTLVFHDENNGENDQWVTNLFGGATFDNTKTYDLMVVITATKVYISLNDMQQVFTLSVAFGVPDGLYPNTVELFTSSNNIGGTSRYDPAIFLPLPTPATTYDEMAESLMLGALPPTNAPALMSSALHLQATALMSPDISVSLVLHLQAAAQFANTGQVNDALHLNVAAMSMTAGENATACPVLHLQAVAQGGQDGIASAALHLTSTAQFANTGQVDSGLHLKAAITAPDAISTPSITATLDASLHLKAAASGYALNVAVVSSALHIQISPQMAAANLALMNSKIHLQADALAGVKLDDAARRTLVFHPHTQGFTQYSDYAFDSYTATPSGVVQGVKDNQLYSLDAAAPTLQASIKTAANDCGQRGNKNIPCVYLRGNIPLDTLVNANVDGTSTGRNPVSATREQVTRAVFGRGAKGVNWQFEVIALGQSWRIDKIEPLAQSSKTRRITGD